MQRKVRGTGLGLPLTRRLAQVLGGRVDLRSEVGKGSVFRAVIPLRYSPDGAAPAPIAAQLPAGVEPDAKPRALIVDDDEAARYLLRKLLVAQPCVVYEVRDGAAGVADAIALRPDVIFLDLNMPGMSGEEALHRFRGDARTRSIPVVIVTGRNVTEADRKAFQGEADAIINKNELSSTLMQRVLRDVVRREGARQ
jgi:CheY-like chemotaxis protein